MPQNILKAAGRRFLNVFRPAAASGNQSRLPKVLAQYYDYSPAKLNQTQLKVGLVLRDAATRPTSSAFIRLIGPLTDPSIKQQLSIELLPENTTTIDDKTDIYIVQRTAYDDLATAKSFVANLRQAGKKLVVDSDDAFGAIDKSHPEYLLQQSRVEALNYLLEQAGQVWLSTEQLAANLPALKQKTFVIANSLDRRLWLSPKKPSAQSGPLQLVYMGTGTHAADLNLILPALDTVAKNQPGSFTLTIIGVAPELPGRSWLQRLEAPAEASIYPGFANWFSNQAQFDIGLCPLVDSEFNSNKSDIKCLDYLAAGIVPVVSNLKPYRSKQLDELIIRVNDLQDWSQILAGLISEPVKTRQANAERLTKASNYIWQQRSSEATAKKLLDLLAKL